MNSVRIWRNRNVCGVELHRGSAVTLAYPRHWHDDVYLCAVLDGANHVSMRGTSSRILRGAVAVIPPGEAHSNEKVRCTFRCMFVAYENLRMLVERFFDRGPAVINLRPGLIPAPHAATTFLRMHQSLEMPCSELARDHAMVVFLENLLSLPSAAELRTHAYSEDATVARAKRFLDERYAERVSLRELADLTGLSPYHLNRSFSLTVGMPPHAYQLQVRLARAKAFLRDGWSLAETAALTGFFDQSHFTQRFKRSERMTPLQYLRYRKNIQDNGTHTAYFGRR